METYGPQGLMVVQVLFDADIIGTRPTATFLDAWVAGLNPAGAVGIDPARKALLYNTSGTTPLNIILESASRKVLYKFNGYHKESTASMIKAALGLTQP